MEISKQNSICSLSVWPEDLLASGFCKSFLVNLFDQLWNTKMYNQLTLTSILPLSMCLISKLISIAMVMRNLC